MVLGQMVLSSLRGGWGMGCAQGGGQGGGSCQPRGHPRSRTVAPQHLQLVRQEMAVCPEQLSEFVDSLRQYVRGTAGAGNCFQ